MPFLGTTGGGSVKQYGGQANLGYFIKNSLRLRSANSAYLNRTSGTPTSQNIYTISFWVKRGKLGATQEILGAGTVATDAGRMDFLFNSDDTITIAGGLTVFRKTNAVFRDPSAWYHVVLSVSLSGTVNLYVNNVAQTFGTSNTWTTSAWNSASTVHRFGYDGSGGYFDGYLTEINFIDGQALTPSSFGKTDAATGQWIPKKFAGTYGTNGFYLKFSDTSGITAATIGKDSSGSGNNWTPSGISITAGSTYDAMIDSPTLSGAASNYAVLNPLDKGTNATSTDGNLNFSMGGSNNYEGIRATIGISSSGKWYWEATYSGLGYISAIGIATASVGINGTTATSTRTLGTGSWFNTNNSGVVQYNTDVNTTSGINWSGASQPSSNDVYMVALDMDSGKMWIGKNGTWFNSSGTANPATGTDPRWSSLTGFTWFPYSTEGSTSVITKSFNFGQRPFSYTPPSGFKSLNTFNLP